MEPTALISASAITFSSIVAFANLIMMGLLTQAIHKHSIRSAKLETLRQNSSQWRQLNLAAIHAPRLQALLDGDEPKSANERHMRRNVLFYILNGLHEVFLAAKTGIVPNDEALGLIRQQMTVLAPHGSDIAALFALSRGYDPKFAELLQRELCRLREGPAA